MPPLSPLPYAVRHPVMALARQTSPQREFVPAARVRDRQPEGDLICSSNKKVTVGSSFAHLASVVPRPLEPPIAVSAKTKGVKDEDEEDKGCGASGPPIAMDSPGPLSPPPALACNIRIACAWSTQYAYMTSRHVFIHACIFMLSDYGVYL